MWIHSGDSVKNNKNEVLEILSISGLYSSADNITVELKNLHTQEKLTMNYMSEFYPQIESKTLVPFEIKKKLSRGY